ncbi:15667_t:CDS:1, partial [Acaulospora colombiana]
AISSTYLHQNAGTCTSIKIAHTGMDSKKVIKNVETSIPAVVRKLHQVNTRRKPQAKDKKVGEVVPSSKYSKSEEELKQEREEAWENIQSLGIKTHSSVCLPIWSCDLSDRWISAAPTSATPINAVTNGTKSAKKSSKAHEEDDDTMSEGESEELDRKLSEKMKKSTLGSPKKKTNDVLPEEGAQTKKKKRKAEGDEESGPVKKTKLLSTSKSSTNDVPLTSDPTASSVTAKRKPSSQSDATLSSQDDELPKKRKAERAKAADFLEMEEDVLPETASSLPKASEKNASKSAA